ncbi:hypothetical protein BB559_005031 [Furculomyces boomerangus]|uniref:Extracellular membrane protein CFEM domain-containing protein n=1 Tax=Furculomyces boomerangus TaxID=61424 RepID=A0A2T9YB94_9FUNG|nr:hypothetical protein BB559_005031 [Furculomyces boomerangus]
MFFKHRVLLVFCSLFLLLDAIPTLKEIQDFEDAYYCYAVTCYSLGEDEILPCERKCFSDLGLTDIFNKLNNCSDKCETLNDLDEIDLCHRRCYSNIESAILNGTNDIGGSSNDNAYNPNTSTNTSYSDIPENSTDTPNTDTLNSDQNSYEFFMI